MNASDGGCQYLTISSSRTAIHFRYHCQLSSSRFGHGALEAAARANWDGVRLRVDTVVIL
jgi:hypothetical protein